MDCLGDVRSTTRTVSFAHFTVWEYISSSRILDSCAKAFAIEKAATNLEFAKTLILEAQNIEHDDDGRISECESDDSLSEIMNELVDENFHYYCVLSSTLCVRCWGREFSLCDDLRALSFELLDPSKRHFENLKADGASIEIGTKLFSHNEISPAEQFWNIHWLEPPPNHHIYQLLNLLYADKSCQVARVFLRGINIEDILQTNLNLDIEIWRLIYLQDTNRYKFRGNIVELGALLISSAPNWLPLFLEVGAGCFDPTTILPSCIGWHYPSGDNRIVSHLLELGATPNISRYKVQPLQMAAATWDFDGVKLLLERGADPNGIGQSQTMLALFRSLQGKSPLHIIRSRVCFCHEFFKMGRLGAPERIEALLTQYGAREFTQNDQIINEF